MSQPTLQKPQPVISKNLPVRTTRKIQALTFCWEFPPHISGGLGTACHGMIKALTRQRVDVLCVIPKALEEGLENDDIRIINASDIILGGGRDDREHSNALSPLDIHVLLRPYVATKEQDLLMKEVKSPRRMAFVGGYGEDLLDEIQNYALVAKEIAYSHCFDIIHAHDWMAFPAAIEAKRVKNKPMVAHVHSTEFDRSGHHVRQEIYDLERRGMHAADQVIAVSRFTKNILIRHYNVPDTKIKVIHNGVVSGVSDRPKFQKAITEKIVTFLGRVTHQKGPEYFIEVAARILKEHKNVRFVMAGSGNLLEDMVRKVAELQLGSHFHFTGFLTSKQVEQLFAISDVYVMPSVSEPFGITPLEAMRSDVPVIISKQSGASEILKHAIKVNFWDTDALADAILAIIRLDALSSFMKENGRVEVNKITWEKQAMRIKTIYHTLTAKR